MQFHITGRQMGKTYNLLMWLASHPRAVVVCHSQQEADRLHQLATEHFGMTFADKSQFKSINTAPKELRGVDKLIAIDNLDLILRYMLGDVRYVTATGTTIMHGQPRDPNDATKGLRAW